MLDDLIWTKIGDEDVPIFGPTSIFLNTVMSIVKGLANREPTGSHVLDLARQLHAADDVRLAEFERAVRDQQLEKSFTVAKRAVLVMTGVAPRPTPTWFVPDDSLLEMLLVPGDPGKIPPGMKVLEVADIGDALRVLPRSRRREAPREEEDRR